MLRKSWVSLAVVLAAFLAAGSCRKLGSSPRAAAPLTDLYTPAAIETPAPASGSGGTLLPLEGWEAGPGVADFKLRAGSLTGRSTSDLPVIHLAWPAAPGGADTVHAIVLKMRVSAGATVALSSSGDDKAFDLAKEVADLTSWPWRNTATIHPGEELRTVEIVPPLTLPAKSLRHVMIRPTDRAGATFAIESVRVVLREDYLKGIPSGVSWQGLSEVYRETLVSRSPEIMRFPVTLPANPWLDLALGTVEDAPVTFRVGVDVRPTSQFGEPPKALLLERTLTRGDRWEPAGVDLSAFAGQRVTLTLGLTAGSPGTIGLWGSPVVRDRGRPVARGAPRGVILVWADTLRRDHLGTYGYARATSPQIDRLASEGTTFDSCVGQATWTKVATPAMMTSLYPATNGVRQFYDRLPAAATTMAEVFHEAGYATVSYSSILFTGQMTNLHQGFEEVHESGSLPDQESSKTAREYVDRLNPWLAAHKEVPFFVFLHVSDPHDPFKPYAPYDTLFNDGGKAAEHERQSETVRKIIKDPLMKQFGMPNRAELVQAGVDPDAYTAFNEGWYDGSIRAMDVEIGRVMEQLRALGLSDKTLVVVTGDHGEEFLEHGRSFHGQSVYGELTNVPLILHFPGSVPAGKRVSDAVEAIDIMPTLLTLSGLPVPQEAQGASLVPLMSGAPWTRRPAISQKAETDDGNDCPPPHETESFAITADGWKLIENVKRAPGAPEFELYDAARDPLDREDAAAAHPEVVARLAAALASWKAKAEAERLPPDSESNKTLKPEDLERLRSLGYVR